MSNFGAEEAGKFYPRKSDFDTWYHYVYGSEKISGVENKLATHLICREQYGDVAIVRSCPKGSNDYPEEFTRAELVTTAKFYETESHACVPGKKEVPSFQRVWVGSAEGAESSDGSAADVDGRACKEA
ncbi:uncharacterized protein BDV17DRAFT_286351 [Aspergillus undulatus]|uniref:uncharacterized protein n=1 Tax=Aspergillus undulatus TaxID=1810928 RepID=UPI003CCCFEA0